MINALLERLDKVKERGEGSWIACCPAHEDKTPSLSIRETSDGTILVHDFAGCSPVDILSAVGLELKDLFPKERRYQSLKKRHRKMSQYTQAVTL